MDGPKSYSTFFIIKELHHLGHITKYYFQSCLMTLMHFLEWNWPIELSEMMGMFYVCTVQGSSH